MSDIPSCDVENQMQNQNECIKYKPLSTEKITENTFIQNKKKNLKMRKTSKKEIPVSQNTLVDVLFKQGRQRNDEISTEKIP